MTSPSPLPPRSIHDVKESRETNFSETEAEDMQYVLHSTCPADKPKCSVII